MVCCLRSILVEGLFKRICRVQSLRYRRAYSGPCRSFKEGFTRGLSKLTEAFVVAGWEGMHAWMKYDSWCSVLPCCSECLRDTRSLLYYATVWGGLGLGAGMGRLCSLGTTAT